ncbi:hypothetical protein LCGC14_1530020 [marine sediment metagenome]|uniref:Uncharacterized protein n=1 Tax=marine sediment metagenome TaxID=412755 RepID=A0A0F9IW28_9ZZZZ
MCNPVASYAEVKATIAYALTPNHLKFMKMLLQKYDIPGASTNWDALQVFAWMEGHRDQRTDCALVSSTNVGLLKYLLIHSTVNAAHVYLRWLEPYEKLLLLEPDSDISRKLILGDPAYPESSLLLITMAFNLRDKGIANLATSLVCSRPGAWRNVSIILYDKLILNNYNNVSSLRVGMIDASNANASELEKTKLFLQEVRNQQIPVNILCEALEEVGLSSIIAQVRGVFDLNDTDISDLVSLITIANPNAWKNLGCYFHDILKCNAFHPNIAKTAEILFTELRNRQISLDVVCVALTSIGLAKFINQARGLSPQYPSSAPVQAVQAVVPVQAVQVVQAAQTVQAPNSAQQQDQQSSWKTMTLPSIFYQPSPDMMENTSLKKSQLKIEKYFGDILNKDAYIFEAIAEGVTINKNQTYRELSSVQFIRQRLSDIPSKTAMKILRKTNKKGKKLSAELLTALTSKAQEQMLEDMQDHQDIAELAAYLESKSSKIGKFKHEGKGMKVSDLLTILTGQGIYDVESFQELGDRKVFKEFKEQVTLSFPQIRALRAALES